MEAYRKTMSLIAVVALLVFAYTSFQTNSELNLMMTVTHSLAMYAILLNKERK